MQTSVTDTERKQKHDNCINNLLPALALLRKKTDFVEEEIYSFQKGIDCFFQDLVESWREKFMSNYIHMHQSGHIAELLFHWKNSCKCSQQGWEALNGAMKTFFFRRTNRGGFSGNENKKIKLEAIARWLQRRMMFMCSFSEEEIANCNVACVGPPSLVQDL